MATAQKLAGPARISLEASASHVLWFHGEAEGCRPDRFTEKLLEAWSEADVHDQAKMYNSWPGLVACLLVYNQNGSQGLQKMLKEI